MGVRPLMMLQKAALGVLLAVCTQLLAGCGDSQPTASEATVPPAIDPNSIEAINLAQQAREAMPGRKVYDAACASCHEGAMPRAPHRQMLILMTPEAVMQALTEGLMSTQGAALSDSEKTQVAEYIGGRALGSNSSIAPRCAPATAALSGTSNTHNWGFTPDNKRHIDAALTEVNTQTVGQLKPRWAFAFDGANRARSQPLMLGNRVIVGSHSGEVLSLDADTGCVQWSFAAAAEVRTGIVTDNKPGADGTALLYFGDVLGNVYAINSSTGASVWRSRADAHPNATITGTPSLFEDTLYVPVSALEVSNAMDETYECCTFRGSVHAFDRNSGTTRWQTYTIDQPPTEQGLNSAGTRMFGPSGAVIWNSPSIDTKRRRLYVGTGENASSPATKTSDALIAMDLDSGSIVWSWQGTMDDAWNTACGTSTPANCPKEDGPDFDFGANTLIATNSKGQDLVIGGQKSGLVHAINADTGQHEWSSRVGRGGIQGGVHFGIAADDTHIYVPISDMADGKTYPDPDQPGIHALSIDDGSIKWSAASPDTCNGRDFCHPGVSQSISVVDDVVIGGSMDGTLRAYASATGKLLYELDTTTEFTTTGGGTTNGGSFGGAAGPVAEGNRVLISSGYGMYNHMPGNLLLMLELPAQIN